MRITLSVPKILSYNFWPALSSIVVLAVLSTYLTQDFPIGWDTYKYAGQASLVLKEGLVKMLQDWGYYHIYFIFIAATSYAFFNGNTILGAQIFPLVLIPLFSYVLYNYLQHISRKIDQPFGTLETNLAIFMVMFSPSFFLILSGIHRNFLALLISYVILLLLEKKLKTFKNQLILLCLFSLVMFIHIETYLMLTASVLILHLIRKNSLETIRKFMIISMSGAVILLPIVPRYAENYLLKVSGLKPYGIPDFFSKSADFFPMLFLILAIIGLVYVLMSPRVNIRFDNAKEKENLLLVSIRNPDIYKIPDTIIVMGIFNAILLSFFAYGLYDAYFNGVTYVDIERLVILLYLNVFPFAAMGISFVLLFTRTLRRSSRFIVVIGIVSIFLLGHIIPTSASVERTLDKYMKSFLPDSIKHKLDLTSSYLYERNETKGKNIIFIMYGPKYFWFAPLVDEYLNTKVGMHYSYYIPKLQFIYYMADPHEVTDRSKFSQYEKNLFDRRAGFEFHRIWRSNINVNNSVGVIISPELFNRPVEPSLGKYHVGSGIYIIDLEKSSELQKYWHINGYRDLFSKSAGWSANKDWSNSTLFQYYDEDGKKDLNLRYKFALDQGDYTMLIRLYDHHFSFAPIYFKLDDQPLKTYNYEGSRTLKEIDLTFSTEQGLHELNVIIAKGEKQILTLESVVIQPYTDKN